MKNKPPHLIPFFKYHGAGNDFIMLDHRAEPTINLGDDQLIARLCDRHFGIGADGLIALAEAPGFDFEMKYYNADGKVGSMCGNGGRCAVAFARLRGNRKTHFHFLAADGPHEAYLREMGWVELKMGDVQSVESGKDYFFLDTGSPHYVRLVGDLPAVDVLAAGRAIRYNERFKKEGTNVNFVQHDGLGIDVATYERGVEGETLSCGTGVTASALAAYLKWGDEKDGPVHVPVRTKGGELDVRFLKTPEGFTDIWLCGPTQLVFEGSFSLPG